MKNKIQFLLCLIFGILMMFAQTVLAQDSVINLILLRGNVQLLDTSGQRFPAKIGQKVYPVQFPQLELESNATIFLKRGNRLIQLSKPGIYSIDSLFTPQTPRLDNAISFLKQLSQPRLYSTNSLVRGTKSGKPLDDDAYFEALWERIVAESEERVSSMPAADLLSASAWFTQQGKKARVAFILERLSGQKAGENEFYHQMRLEALRGIRLAEINRELETTRQKVAAQTATLRYKALLIGINNYEHSAWQGLKNPISDVRAIRQVLVEYYQFKPADVISLEDASYDEIVEAFNQLKQFTGDNTSLLVYYAGHGFYPQDEGEGYWIPKDAGEPDSLRLFLPTSTVLGKINSIKTKHTLLIADSCFSGSLIRKTRGVENNSRFYQDLSGKKSRQIITSGGLEPVDDQGAGNHSIFAGKFLSILKQNRQEPLSASELAFNLRKEVKNAWGNQTPEYGRLQIKDDENGEFFFVQLEEKAEMPVVVVPPASKPRKSKSREYSYENLPKGMCLAPKPFTDLRKCKFSNKKIEDINLEGANLEGVDFKYSELEDINLKGANLINTDWRYSKIDSLIAINAVIENSDWRYTKIDDSNYSHSNLHDSDFRYSRLQDIKFDYADLSGSDIRYCSMDDVSMVETNLMDVQSSDDQFSETIQGIFIGIKGAIEGIKKKDETEEPINKSPTSVDNRKESYIYLGVKPFSASMPENELRPFNLGVYLGKNLQLGAEYGSVTSTNSTSTSDAEAVITLKGVYIRLFTESSFNVMFAMNQYSWLAEATSETAPNSGLSMTVTEAEVTNVATFAIGNQWLLDSGITIGADWALFSGQVGDPELTRSVKDKGGSSSEIADADKALNDLEEKLEKEILISDRAHYLSLSLGFSF